MGPTALAVTAVAGLALPVLLWAVAIRGRYALVRGPAAPPLPVARALGPTVGGASLRVGGMTCAACVDKVRRGVSALPGVAEVAVDLADGKVTLRWTAGFSGLDAVRAALTDLGYDA
jgi:copper chaperone CopZ